MLPQQPCSRPGAWHAVEPAGHEDAMGARYDHRIRSGMNEITSSLSSLTPDLRPIMPVW